MKVSPSTEFTAVPADAKLPMKYGSSIRSVDPRDGAEHAAIYYGDMNDQTPARSLAQMSNRCPWKFALRLYYQLQRR